MRLGFSGSGADGPVIVLQSKRSDYFADAIKYHWSSRRNLANNSCRRPSGNRGLGIKIMSEPEWLDGLVAFVERTQIKSTMIRAVEEAWHALAGDRRFPRRRD